MTSSSKRKGNGFETEICDAAKEKGLPARRAYASNGLALGEVEAVDCLIAGLRIQAKRRKKIADFLQVPDGCDCVVFRQDRGDSMVLMDYARFLELLKNSED